MNDRTESWSEGKRKNVAKSYKEEDAMIIHVLKTYKNKRK